MSIVVRSATPDDLAEVMALIAQLAAFENLPGPDAGALARLLRDTQGPAPRVIVLVAARDSAGGRVAERNDSISAEPVVGYAICFWTYSTFLCKPTLFLEDIFVTPDARRAGAGDALFQAAHGLAVREGAGRMEWMVLDWNQNAQAFFAKRGGRMERDWNLWRITL